MVVPPEWGKMADTQSEVTNSTRSDDMEYKRKFEHLMANISKQQSKQAKKIKEKRVKKRLKTFRRNCIWV